MQIDYGPLIEAAVADVDSGAAVRRNCETSEECRIMTGCIRCAGVLRGEVGIERIDVFPRDNGVGVIRITTTGGHKSPMPCVVSLKEPLTIHA